MAEKTQASSIHIGNASQYAPISTDIRKTPPVRKPAWQRIGTMPVNTIPPSCEITAMSSRTIWRRIDCSSQQRHPPNYPHDQMPHRPLVVLALYFPVCEVGGSIRAGGEKTRNGTLARQDQRGPKTSTTATSSINNRQHWPEHQHRLVLQGEKDAPLEGSQGPSPIITPPPPLPSSNEAIPCWTRPKDH